MKSIASASLLLLSELASSLAQDMASLTSASVAAATTGISPQLENERAECFQDCYRKYGSFPSCPLGKDKFLECWCGEDDWKEKEEDCVWDVCGVDAYNSYGDVQRSLCAKVKTPSDKDNETTTSTLAAEQSSQTTAKSETTASPSETAASTSAQTEASGSASDTISSSTSSSAQEQTVEATKEPNGGVVGLTSGAKAGLVVGVAYLVLMIL
ncbi:hypothetical protein ACHAPT_006461 [Fusarium lateritium]